MNCKGSAESAMWGSLESKMVWKNLNLFCFVQVFLVYLKSISTYKGGWWGWVVGHYFARLFFQNKDFITKDSSEAAETPKNNDFQQKMCVVFWFYVFFFQWKHHNFMILLCYFNVQNGKFQRFYMRSSNSTVIACFLLKNIVVVWTHEIFAWLHYLGQVPGLMDNQQGAGINARLNGPGDAVQDFDRKNIGICLWETMGFEEITWFHGWLLGFHRKYVSLGQPQVTKSVSRHEFCCLPSKT